MYALIDQGVISEIKYGNNFAYVVPDDTKFNMTDYKVLLNQTDGVFIECYKLKLNDKTEIYYLADQYRSLSNMFKELSTETFLEICANVFTSIDAVKNNGFLSCQSIDLSWDKIYVDVNTLKIKLVYIPVKSAVFKDYSEFESSLRSSFVKLIEQVVQDRTPSCERFKNDLMNVSISFRDLSMRLRADQAHQNNQSAQMQGTQNQQAYVPQTNVTFGRMGNGSFAFQSVLSQNGVSQQIRTQNISGQESFVQANGDSNLFTDSGTSSMVAGSYQQSVAGTLHQNMSVAQGGGLRLVAINSPVGVFEVILNRQYQLIGKKQEVVDICIPFNKMISRKHCEVINENGQFYIRDVGSANGTYVNGMRINPGQMVPINRGDAIRLANSDFKLI